MKNKKWVVLRCLVLGFGVAVLMAGCGSAQLTAVTSSSGGSGSTDTTAPTNASIIINSGAITTAETSVSLAISASDEVNVTAYYIAESIATPDAKSSSWGTIAVPNTKFVNDNVSFTLSSDRGTKEVFIWFKDAADNISMPASDKIILITREAISTQVIAISARNNGSHSLFLKSDGTVWAAGYNSQGQLGNGTTTDSNLPVIVTNLTGITTIAAGSNHSLALDPSGFVTSWGRNASGECGDGKTSDHYIFALKIPLLSKIVSISAGKFFSVALDSSGSVWAWGANDVGQLGNGGTVMNATPGKVQLSAGGYLSNIIAITCGASHALALDSSGNIWAWGSNRSGQLGNNSSTNSSYPVQVSSLSGVSAIAAGGGYSLALISGTVYAWGGNGSGQLGDGTTTESLVPKAVSGLSGVSFIADAGAHTLVLTSTGNVYAWGSDSNGQLGDGLTTNRTSPYQLTSISNVSYIVGGGAFTLALKSDGTLWVWGKNSNGQLGIGSTTDVFVPTLMPGF